MSSKRLFRSHDSICGGVCGGIADYFGLDPSLVRIGYAALTIFSAAFPGLLLYLIMWCIVPKDTSQGT